MTRHPSIIYKVCDRQLWEEAERLGEFTGAEIDLADGFIHFSTGSQVQETVRKHFAGREDLVLVSVATAELGEALRWEKSRNDELFPHLYETLKTSHAIRVDTLPLEGDDHNFPKDLDFTNESS